MSKQRAKLAQERRLQWEKQGLHVLNHLIWSGDCKEQNCQDELKGSGFDKDLSVPH